MNFAAYVLQLGYLWSPRMGNSVGVLLPHFSIVHLALLVYSIVTIASQELVFSDDLINGEFKVTNLSIVNDK